jgi:small subunit ribosomal protein S7
MLKRYKKDFLERLINHTMRHGKKGAAIGLLAKSFSLFRQGLVRQGGVSRYLSLRRVEERSHFLCTLLGPVASRHQSPFALNISRPDAAKTLETRSGDPLTLAFSAVVSSPLPVKGSGLQETGVTTDTRLYECTLNNLKIGSTPSHFVSCNKAPSATTEARTGLALMSVKNASQDNQVQRRARGRNTRSSIKAFVKDAISHIKPSLETRKKKIAGVARHVPAIVPLSRGEGVAIRWVLSAAKEKQRRGGRELAKCLSDELLDAYLKRGEARQKRDLLHKLAEGNRSYVRYRWW